MKMPLQQSRLVFQGPRGLRGLQGPMGAVGNRVGIIYNVDHTLGI